MQDNYKTGLTDEQVKKKLSEYGLNTLKSKKRKSVISLFLDQFKDAMVLILLGATAISAVMGEIYDAVTIILIVLLDAVLGFVQEFRTEKTMEALEKLTSPTARVIRGGTKTEIDASNIVPDDIVCIEAGDRIPCDGNIISCNGLWCDESILTGESEAVRKAEYGDGEHSSGVVYMGASVTRGNAVVCCTQTGMNTKMGQMSALIDDAGGDETPLQKKLAALGKVLCGICIGVCFLVALAGILRGEPVFDMLMTGITIAIAAIPEGLPATVTISLALAVRRMLKRNALVHRLHSVETLGCTTVICTDKTGTLTENKMRVTRIYSDMCDYELSPSKGSKAAVLSLDSKPTMMTDTLRELLRCCALCNNCEISDDGEVRSSDPTEAALLSAAAGCGMNIQELRQSYMRISEVPFESETKMMSVTVRHGSRESIIYTKGAPDVIIKRCGMYQSAAGVKKLTPAMRQEFYKIVDGYASKALRVMAFSYSEGGDEIFIGLAGMIDAPRKEARSSVARLRRAGIRTVMITGDHRLTAEAIAKEVGILRFGGLSVGKEELDGMSDAKLSKIIGRACVFSRVDPKDKLRIVSALKKNGAVVAMTGDGVNDAPAIKEADIGVAMGKTGTDACKQAADIILLDDDFSTLCQAVKEGRTVYSNIRKFVRYLISCNIGEVAVMFLSIILGMPVILLPTQILLVNLVTDGLPAIALGLEKAEDGVTEQKPSDFSGGFFSGGLLSKIIIRGILIGVCTLGCFAYSLNVGCSLIEARTCALVTLIASQLIHVFECRSEKVSVFRMNPFKNPWLIGAVLISAAVTLLCLYVPILSEAMEVSALIMPQMIWSLIFAAAVPVASGLAMLIFKGRK